MTTVADAAYEHEHVTSPLAAIVVFVVLLVLLVLTVVAAEIRDHTIGIIVALTIAVVKAVLIVYFFMNIRFADVVTRFFVVSGFLWLALLLSIMMADYISRYGANDERGQAPIAGSES
jgi:cytochrome c oxidase subunit 4